VKVLRMVAQCSDQFPAITLQHGIFLETLVLGYAAYTRCWIITDPENNFSQMGIFNCAHSGLSSID
jgi:GH18 family chitinase